MEVRNPVVLLIVVSVLSGISEAFSASPIGLFLELSFAECCSLFVFVATFTKINRHRSSDSE